MNNSHNPINRLEKICLKLDGFLKPWQMKLKTGDYAVMFVRRKEKIAGIFYCEILQAGLPDLYAGRFCDVRRHANGLFGPQEGVLHRSVVSGVISNQSFKRAEALNWPHKMEDFLPIVSQDFGWQQQALSVN